MISSKKNILVFLSLALFLFACGAPQDKQGDNIEVAVEEAEAVNIPESTYKTRSKIENPEEIVMIHLTSSACGICTLDETKAAVIRVKNEIGEKINAKGYGFSAIGVAINWDNDRGYNHLKEYGEYDEVLIGNNWMGTGGLKYLFDEHPGNPSIPQLIFAKRTYNQDAGFIRGVDEEEVLTRIITTELIMKFYEDGMEIPGLE